jgi:twinkle protein
MLGIRARELTTICAGTGVGKSQMLKELCYYLLRNTKDSIGALFLEESIEMTQLHLMGIHAKKPLHKLILKHGYTPYKTEIAKYHQEIMSEGRIFHHDHFGSTNIDNILDKVKYMVKVHNCKYIFLDHLSILTSSQEYGNERALIDSILTKLKTFAENTHITIFLVSHINKAQGKSHEEGSAVSLSELRGSNSIGQLSNNVFSLERNQQHEDETKRNLTLVRVLKNRLVGDTGPACALRLQDNSFRLEEASVEEYFEKAPKQEFKRVDFNEGIETI